MKVTLSKVLNAYTNSMWIEHRPPCNGDEDDYQQLQLSLEALRTDCLALVQSTFNKFGFPLRDVVRPTPAHNSVDCMPLLTSNPVYNVRSFERDADHPQLV